MNKNTKMTLLTLCHNYCMTYYPSLTKYIDRQVVKMINRYIQEPVSVFTDEEMCKMLIQLDKIISEYINKMDEYNYN